MNAATVLITGALSGVGRATALAFANEGANLVVCGHCGETGQSLAAELVALGVKADFMLADMTEEAQVRSLIGQTIERFGRLDVAVNNSGLDGEPGPFAGQTLADYYRAAFETRVLGLLLGLKHQLPVMLKQGAGSVINLSSISGHIGSAGAAVHVASKHAVEGLTTSAAFAVAAQGVRVNAVELGPVAKAMFGRVGDGSLDGDAGVSLRQSRPAQRGATPEAIAQTIVFLASNKARCVTGQCISLAGGQWPL